MGEQNYRNMMDPEFIPMLRRSPCKWLYRSIETWANPPDFPQIISRMTHIREATGKNYLHQMMIAEVVPRNNSSAFPADYRQFDFSQMCAPVQETTAYGSDMCIPSFGQTEYRRYLRFITRKAIDSGILSFLFGQVYHQDPDWETHPKAGEVISEIKSYAASKGQRVFVGAQTNHITSATYLKQFDFIEGGVFFNRDNTIGYEDACVGGGIPQRDSPHRNHPWWNCAGHLWHPLFRDNAKAVMIALDWHGQTTDDISRFAKMTSDQRRDLLRQLQAFLAARNVIFIMPYFSQGPVTAEGETQRGCYGLYPWFYSAARTGSATRDRYNRDVPPGPYSCQDEDAIRRIMVPIEGGAEN